MKRGGRKMYGFPQNILMMLITLLTTSGVLYYLKYLPRKIIYYNIGIQLIFIITLVGLTYPPFRQQWPNETLIQVSYLIISTSGLVIWGPFIASIAFSVMKTIATARQESTGVKLLMNIGVGTLSIVALLILYAIHIVLFYGFAP